MSDFSFISNAHPAFVEGLYLQYQQNPEAVEPSWRQFFKGFEFAINGNGKAQALTEVSTDNSFSLKELNVLSLINGYRSRGHLESTTNPLRPRRNRHAKLKIEDYGLSEADLSAVFSAGQEIGLKDATLSQIVNKLKDIYVGNIGFEYCHIEKEEHRNWLRNKIESRNTKDYGLNLQKKRRILEKLNGAVGFEEFLDVRFKGQKRFGLEGGETMIPAIDAMINVGADDKVEEVVIGMAHRGRLNVLANVLGKTYEHIFNEFQGALPEDLSFGSGDVKYHMGYSSQLSTPNGKKVYIKLSPNPSHLEAVNPVVEGFCRAKIDHLYKGDFDKVLPILIHGDAAVVGQGVVYETTQMSLLKGYHTGGTLHFVINNQIGFTVDFEDARSSTYCTAAANMIQAPVFHVNGNDPEAVIYVCELATEFRQKFNIDVFVDMVCYRKHGHNEADAPEVTQPTMYKLIKDQKNPRVLYSEQLIQRGEIEEKMAKEMQEAFKNDLDARLHNVKQHPIPYSYQEPELAWKALLHSKEIPLEAVMNSPQTGIEKEKIENIIQHILTLPDGFTASPQIARVIKGNEALFREGKLDWAMGELLAYGSLHLEGKDIRMSGQDVKRGTFSHRHAVVFDHNTNAQHNRLNGLREAKGIMRIYNSFLSEFAVLGFEYGYAMAHPDNLVIWEAQFGDFSNGAQTIIDQFLASGESKWLRQNGLIMLLPHGYEGQGPEHSSARMERYLQLCGNLNMTVANLTTSANLFHSFRRQLARNFRKPLIIMSPKSGLRHPLSVSPIEDFETGKKFMEVIDDHNVNNIAKRILFCSGKIAYELIAKKEELQSKDIAVVRIEQLYPYPAEQVQKIVDKHKGAEIVWVQEEPANSGAWEYLSSRYVHFKNARLIARPISSSPATGYAKLHTIEQTKIIEESFTI
ncbi:MAG: 2-oxoglutarate dehydrogenase E1 component [Saprospiraceae bacterium]